MPSTGVQTCARSEEHTSELQSHDNLVCRLLLEKKKTTANGQAVRRGHTACTRQPSTPRGRGSPRLCVRFSAGRVGGAVVRYVLVFFFFNDPATPEIYPLSLHDALPILSRARAGSPADAPRRAPRKRRRSADPLDRKSTRLNSSHTIISYAVFCLKK